MPILSYAVYFLCFLVIHANSESEFALLVCCYSRWVFKERVIINGCILISQLLFGLCFRCCFLQNPQVFFYINVFCGSRAEVVLRQFLLLDSV